MDGVYYSFIVVSSAAAQSVARIANVATRHIAQCATQLRKLTYTHTHKHTRTRRRRQELRHFSNTKQMLSVIKSMTCATEAETMIIIIFAHHSLLLSLSLSPSQPIRFALLSVGRTRRPVQSKCARCCVCLYQHCHYLLFMGITISQTS